MFRHKNLLILTVLGVLLAVSWLSPLLVSPVQAAANVVIVSHTGYMYKLEYLVVGEVQNVGDVAAKDVYVSITCYDEYGAVIKSADQDVYLDVVLSGRKAPFKHNFGYVDADRIHHYTIGVHYTEDPIGKPLGLQIMSNSSYFAPDFIRIQGEVKNVGSQTTGLVTVTATHYDGSGEVGDASSVWAGQYPWTLEPGQVANFTILEEITDRESLYVRYELSAESFNYALVPEFPPYMIPLIFMLITLVSVALAKSKTPLQR